MWFSFLTRYNKNLQTEYLTFTIENQISKILNTYKTVSLKNICKVTCHFIEVT